MNKTGFSVGDLIYISDDLIYNNFHQILKNSPALIISIEGSTILTLIGDKIYKWAKWDLEEAVK
jgi:hypothetical protein